MEMIAGWTEVTEAPTTFVTAGGDYDDYVTGITDTYNWSDIGIVGNESAIFIGEDRDLNGTVWGLPIYFKLDVAEFVVFLVNGLLLSGVSLFGIFGNILSASVLSRKRMQSSLSVLLTGLSFCDLTVCTLTFVWIGIPNILWKLKIGSWYINFSCYAYQYIFILWTTAFTGSAYFTVAVSIERYIAVCWPLHFPSLVTYGRSRKISVGILILAAILQIPNILQSVKQEPIPYFDYQCDFGFNLRQLESNVGKTNIYTWIIFMFLIPMGSVFTLNAMILWRIRQQAQEREKLTSYQMKKIQVTNMLVTVVVFYLFCNLIRTVNLVMFGIFRTTYAEQFVLPTLVIAFNCAVNYIIYCAFGRTFRQSFINLFLVCKSSRSIRPIGRSGRANYTCKQCHPADAKKGQSNKNNPDHVIDIMELDLESPKTSVTSLSTTDSGASSLTIVSQYIRRLSLDLISTLGISQQYTVNE